jgi:hypothetical protein
VRAGCNVGEPVSARASEEKVERLRVGQTNRAEIKVLLGSADVVERIRLTYDFADTKVGVGINRYTPPSGVPPVNAGAFPTNASVPTQKFAT